MADFNLQAESIFNVQGLVAVITGGGTGIGLMVAKALDANGAKAVYIIGRRQEKLEEAAKEAKNGSIIPLVCDVTSKDSLAAAADRVEKEQGFLNVLFANSGIPGLKFHGHMPTDRKPTVKEFKDGMWESNMEEFTEALHVNCTCVLYTAVAFLELLDAGNKKDNVEQKSQVLITASIGAYLRTALAGLAYGPSKAAVLHLARQLGNYFAPWSIRVNTLAPGFFPSEMTAPLLKSMEQQPWEEGALASNEVPLMRTGSEQDMAGAALFMISKAGAYCLGNNLVQDGGRMAVLPGSY